jgi:hypothetical protein
MSSPLFVQTSEGWINLALVRVIVDNQAQGTVRFRFQDGEKEVDWVDLPLKEGERIMRQLMETEHILPG